MAFEVLEVRDVARPEPGPDQLLVAVRAAAGERHHTCLRERGAVPVAYGHGIGDRIAAAAEQTPVAAFIHLVGGGYVITEIRR